MLFQAPQGETTERMLVAPAHENPEEVDDENLPMATVVIPLNAYTRAHAGSSAGGSAAGSYAGGGFAGGSAGETKEESGCSRAVVLSSDEASLMEIIKLAKEENDCKGVVDAMRAGRSSKVVLGKGLEAVASLCENRDDRAEAHRVMFSKTLGGIPLLLEVMREHRRSEEIARVSFLAVWSLTRNVDIQRIVGESGGIPLLVEMLEEHGERNAEVAKNGLIALLNLAGNADNKKSIAEAGGIEMILSVMDVHGASNAGVAEQGCDALMSLACNDDNQKRIAEASGIEIILSVMKVHGASNAGVAENGCQALWNLIADAPNTKIIGETGSINADNKRKILAANGVSMVERMKSTWASNEIVQEMADGALGILKRY